MATNRDILLVLALLASSARPAAAAPFAYVANFYGDTVSVIDTATDALIATVPVGGNPGGVAVDCTGSRVYVTNFSSDSISVIDTASHTVAATIPGVTRPNSVVVAPGGDRIFVSQNTIPGIVSVLDTATYATLAEIGVGMLPNRLALSPDGAQLYVINTYDTSESNPCHLAPSSCILTVSVVDTALNIEIRRIQVGRLLGDLAVHPAGTYVYVSGSPVKVEPPAFLNSAIFRIDTTLYSSAPMLLLQSAGGLAIAPSGNPLYVTSLGSVLEIDPERRVVSGQIPFQPTGAMAITQTGDRLYAARDTENTVWAISTRSGQILREIPVGSFPVAIAVGPSDPCPSPPPTAACTQTATPTPSSTTQVPPTTPVPTATPTLVASPCLGDCNMDRLVTIDETVTLVRVALGLAPFTMCPAGDVNDDHAITIDEIMVAVEHVLRGCSP